MSDIFTAGRKFTLTNLGRRPLVLSLNSKESLHLAPGASAHDIAEQELTNNPDVNKLERLNLLRRIAQEASERERSGKKSRGVPLGELGK
jgi:hypothetical protein